MWSNNVFFNILGLEKQNGETINFYTSAEFLFVLKKLLSKSGKQNLNLFGQMTNFISEQKPWFKKVYQIHDRESY